MSHKLQLHLLLDHISAKITANAAIGLRSLANPRLWPIHPFVARNSGYHRKRLTLTEGVIASTPMSEYQMFHSDLQVLY